MQGWWRVDLEPLEAARGTGETYRLTCLQGEPSQRIRSPRLGGAGGGAGPCPCPCPSVPSLGRHVWRAEAPGGVGAPGLRPRVGCGGLSLAAPEPRVPAWSVLWEQVSAAAGASPTGAPSPGVAWTFPHSAEGNAEAAPRLCAPRQVPRRFSRVRGLFSCPVVGTGVAP